MTIIDGLDNLTAPPTGPDGQRCVLSIGNFDGVHRGHQRIIATAAELAGEIGGPVVAMTFQPPPVRLLAPQKAPQPLMQLDQRCEALAAAGAEVVLVTHTTTELLGTEAEAFIRDILMVKLNPAGIVEGPNFFFGHNRSGDVGLLRRMGGELGYETHVVKPVELDFGDGEKAMVSSSLTRRLILAGRVDRAMLCLARPYEMRGQVVHGSGRGRELHFPTVNLDCGEQLIPADGVYAGWARLDGHKIPAAISIGARPTFDDQNDRAVEAHLIDQQGDFYDQPMSLAFVRRLRDQYKYDSPEALIEAMGQDVQRVREIIH